MNSNLAGKVVIVTGASGGIGSAIARQFAAEGAKLVLHYRSNRKSVLALQRSIPGTESLIVRANLTREADARMLMRNAMNRFNRVDTLVANAGMWRSRTVPVQRPSLRLWRSI